jgi:hypothetical protein
MAFWIQEISNFGVVLGLAKLNRDHQIGTATFWA